MCSCATQVDLCDCFYDDILAFLRDGNATEGWLGSLVGRSDERCAWRGSPIYPGQ